MGIILAFGINVTNKHFNKILIFVQVSRNIPSFWNYVTNSKHVNHLTFETLISYS